MTYHAQYPLKDLRPQLASARERRSSIAFLNSASDASSAGILYAVIAAALTTDNVPPHTSITKASTTAMTFRNPRYGNAFLLFEIDFMFGDLSR